MRICIIGFSGSGKSTLAKRLGKIYGIKVIHMDSIHFLANWQERDKNEFEEIMQKHLSENDSWVIDGNYSKRAQNRYDLADMVIMLDFNRFRCIRNAFKRLKMYKGRTRSDMAEGCNEKIDWEFFWWLLYEGRTRKRRKRMLKLVNDAKEGYIFKNHKQVNEFISKLEKEKA